MTSRATTANLGLDLAGKFSCVSGGTHGIGAAVAVRLAKAGSSVIIVGRSEEGGQSVLADLKAHGRPGAEYHFVRTDLSLVSNVKWAAKEIAKKAPKGIDFLFESQGKPPVDPFGLTEEDHEKSFAVQVLSRFGLAYLLLKDGMLKRSLTVVAAAGQGFGTVDVDDLELRKDNNRNFTMFRRANRDAIVIDAFVLEAARLNPSLQFSHIFPGLVSTQQRDLPFGLHRVWNLVNPLVGFTVGHTPQAMAEGVVYIGANPASAASDPKRPRMYSPWLGTIKPSTFAQSAENCKAIYQKLQSVFDAP